MNEFELYVDEKCCKSCGSCLNACPNSLMEEGKPFVSHDIAICDQCMHCMAICPSGAVKIKGKKSNFAPKCLIDSDSMLSHLMWRRSQRDFQSEQISPEKIKLLAKASSYIPSGGNDHRYNITVMTSELKRKEMSQAIKKYYEGISRLMKNPLLKIVAGIAGDAKVKATINDPFYYKKILKHIGDCINGEKDIIFYNAPAVFFFHTDRIMPTAKEDCILSAHNMIMMAETMGIGTCFVSLAQQAVTNDMECKKILDIPESHRVEAVVIAGYPIQKFVRNAVRIEKEANIV